MPTFAKLGYPQIPVACVTELGPELVKKYPLLFFGNGTLTQYSTTVIGILKKFRSSGQIGSKVAMVNVADEYGIEISNISKTQFPAAGFEIVYNKSYPLGTQDYAPVIKAAKSTNPDAFIAWSYPPDTFGLTEQAKIEDFSVKVYFNGIGCAFPGYHGKFGAAAENILGWGGVPDNADTRAFYKLHKEVTGVDADFNGSPLYYANNQLLTQAIEGAGSMDREAIAAHIKSHTYKTLLGEYDMRNQLLNRLYTAGQWQGDWFHAVGGVGYPDFDYVPAKLKTSWAYSSSWRDGALCPVRRPPRWEIGRYISSPATNGRGHTPAIQAILKHAKKSQREDLRWPFALPLSDPGGFTPRWKKTWPVITRVNVRRRKARRSSIARRPKRFRSSAILVSTNGPAANIRPTILSCTCTNA